VVEERPHGQVWLADSSAAAHQALQEVPLTSEEILLLKLRENALHIRDIFQPFLS
jgi:hypothetical protein